MNARLGTLIVMLAPGFVLAPLTSEAQQAANIPRVGVILPGPPGPAFEEAFPQGLGELGYADGRNVIIESRFAPPRTGTKGTSVCQAHSSTRPYHSLPEIKIQGGQEWLRSWKPEPSVLKTC